MTYTRSAVDPTSIVCLYNYGHAGVVVATAEATYIAVTAIATGVLAIATGAFVVAAFRQLRPLKATQKASEEAAKAAARAADAAEQSVEIMRVGQEQQSLLSTYPPLICGATFNDDAAQVAIANTGAMPAHDVEVITLQLLWEENETVTDYLARHGKGGHTPPTPDDEGGYAVRDVIRYALISPHRKVSAQLDFPTVGSQLLVLIQFRDVLDRNYIQFYRLTIQDRKDLRYRRGEVSASGLQMVPRIEFLSPDEPSSATIPSDGPLAQDLAEFLSVLNASIPSGHLKTSEIDWDDRGTWSAL
jgi:hypothetical protein